MHMTMKKGLFLFACRELNAGCSALSLYWWAVPVTYEHAK